MRKLILLAAMLAMVLVAAVPAFASHLDDDTTIDISDVNAQFSLGSAFGDDGSQNAVNVGQLTFDNVANDAEQSNDQSVTINGDQTATGGDDGGDANAGNEIEQDQSNSVEGAQAQYSANLLYGGFIWYF